VESTTCVAPCSVRSPASTCPDGWGEGGEPDPSDDQIWNVLYSKAEDVKALAKSYGLTVLMLQPLNQFDGWPEGSPRANWVRRKAERWLPLCAKLGVEMLQVRAQLCLAAVRKGPDPSELRSCRKTGRVQRLSRRDGFGRLHGARPQVARRARRASAAAGQDRL
jgi:predicted xylose isomerase-like sugar epimerase